MHATASLLEAELPEPRETVGSEPPQRAGSRFALVAFAAVVAVLVWLWMSSSPEPREVPTSPEPVAAVAAVESHPPIAAPMPIDAGPEEPSEIVAASEDAGRPNLAAPFCSVDDLEGGYSRPSVHAYVFDHVPRTDLARTAMAESRTLGTLVHKSPGLADDDAPVPGSALAIAYAWDVVDAGVQARPGAASSWALAYEVEKGSGSLEAADELLRRAEALDPQAAAFPWALSEDLRVSGDLPAAIAALQAYVKLQPGDAAAKRKLARLGVEAEIESSYPLAQSGGVRLRASPEFARVNDLRAVADQIRAARDEAARFTGFTPRDPLSVVILPGREELMAVSCVNDWAGGFYDGTIKLVEGPRHSVNMVDLRHELVHAVALSRLPSSKPLWFTEGVADFFASPKRQHPHAEQLMVANRTVMPVESLVGTLQTLNAADAELAYAESDALVAMLVEEHGPSTVEDAFTYLRQGGSASKLDESVLGHAITTDELLHFLERRVGPGGIHPSSSR